MLRFILAMMSLTFSVSLWANAQCEAVSGTSLVNNLKLHGFKCSSLTIGACSYSECQGQVGSGSSTYPLPVLFTIPSQADSLRLHFHGHILGMKESLPYEGSLSKMVRAFGLQKSLCEHKEVTVIPQSVGKNSTYSNYFKSSANYSQFLKDVKFAMGNFTNEFPLHLSGHSGGGKYVAAGIEAGLKPHQVSVFDGIYSPTTKDTLKNWFKKGEGKLQLSTVQGQSPDNFASQLRADLGIKTKAEKNSIQGVSYDVYKSGFFTQYSRPLGSQSGLEAHFNVVKETWPASY